MHGTMTVGLVIPAHNEEQGLPAVLEAVPDTVDKVFVVNNCSTDRTAEVAEQYGCIVVDQPVKGYGSAYKAGFAAVDTDLVCTADADGTYPVDRIPELLDCLTEENLDFISARRIPDDHSHSLNNVMRFSGNFILTLVTMLLFWRKILDSQSGMWVFRRSVLDHVNLTSDGMPLSEELKIEVWINRNIKARETGVPFSYSDRMGKAKLNLWRDGFRNLVFLFAKRFGIPMTGA
ncbi:glycosyl transferase family 2 [Candidatus Fermentibacteria bacterium]|nr:MAG: glycosyl transferase family 2 [Candidatus Fermentibacteria bacterium]